MTWTLDKSRPICPQICELICVAVANGELAAGERLLSVREIALLAGVNPNTVQKSFEELERRGVIHSVRCSGWYVNENTSAAVEELGSLRIKKTEDKKAKTPFDEAGKMVYQKAFRKGLAWVPAGHILRMSPPIIMPDEVAMKGMDIIEEAIVETQKELLG